MGAVVLSVGTLAAMTRARGAATGRDGDVAQVDLDDFPTTWPVQQSPWSRRLWVALSIFWLAYLVFGLIVALDVFLVVLAAAQVALSLVNVVLMRTQRVQLEPEGYRFGNAFFGGRLRLWSTVDHVRPGRPRWGTHAELHRRSATWGPVPLHGMTEEQALELQRRVVAARAESRTAEESG